MTACQAEGAGRAIVCFVGESVSYAARHPKTAEPPTDFFLLLLFLLPFVCG